MEGPHRVGPRGTCTSPMSAPARRTIRRATTHLAETTLLNLVPIDPSRVHRMQAERADLDAAAEEYSDLLASSLPATTAGAPTARPRPPRARRERPHRLFVPGDAGARCDRSLGDAGPRRLRSPSIGSRSPTRRSTRPPPSDSWSPEPPSTRRSRRPPEARSLPPTSARATGCLRGSSTPLLRRGDGSENSGSPLTHVCQNPRDAAIDVEALH